MFYPMINVDQYDLYLYPRHMPRGYIVFVFSVHVCVCLCVCKLLFCVQDLSGTTIPRKLIFSTHDGYDQLYCGKENRGCVARSFRVIPLCYICQ